MAEGHWNRWQWVLEQLLPTIPVYRVSKQQLINRSFNRQIDVLGAIPRHYNGKLDILERPSDLHTRWYLQRVRRTAVIAATTAYSGKHREPVVENGIHLVADKHQLARVGFYGKS